MRIFALAAAAALVVSPALAEERLGDHQLDSVVAGFAVTPSIGDSFAFELGRFEAFASIVRGRLITSAIEMDAIQARGLERADAFNAAFRVPLTAALDQGLTFTFD